eukprot:sb/3470967/
MINKLPSPFSVHNHYIIMKLTNHRLQPTETSKQPIRNRYLGQATGYQPIRNQYYISLFGRIQYLQCVSKPGHRVPQIHKARFVVHHQIPGTPLKEMGLVPHYTRMLDTPQNGYLQGQLRVTLSGEGQFRAVRYLLDNIAIQGDGMSGESGVELQSDPYLVTPDLVTPRFSDMINFPRYRKFTVFDPDLVPSPI